MDGMGRLKISRSKPADEGLKSVARHLFCGGRSRDANTPRRDATIPLVCPCAKFNVMTLIPVARISL